MSLKLMKMFKIRKIYYNTHQKPTHNPPQKPQTNNNPKIPPKPTQTNFVFISFRHILLGQNLNILFFVVFTFNKYIVYN